MNLQAVSIQSFNHLFLKAQKDKLCMKLNMMLVDTGNEVTLGVVSWVPGQDMSVPAHAVILFTHTFPLSRSLPPRIKQSEDTRSAIC